MKVETISLCVKNTWHHTSMHISVWKNKNRDWISMVYYRKTSKFHCQYIKAWSIFHYANPEIHRNTKCGGPDSNRRTPTGMDPKSIAFNLARQPPQWYPTFKESILKVFKIGWDEEKYLSLTFNRWRISGYMGLNIFLVIHVIRVIQNVR